MQANASALKIPLRDGINRAFLKDIDLFLDKRKQLIGFARIRIARKNHIVYI
jgi:hypothetical protein